MNMQQVTGLSLLLLLAARPTGARAMEDGPHSDAPGSAEYKRADANFYGRGDVLRAHPSAVILTPDAYTKTGDSYSFTPKTKAPKTLYAETITDWIEPITPPDMPASLGVPSDQMQIREPQGDVEVALPSAPTNFSSATANMTLPNGAVLKTGADGTAAVLFGGVFSARLMPNSEAAVQQTLTPQSRDGEVDLTAGGVFSKVGTQVGLASKYEVHTQFGNASASGGDFVTVLADSRTDVWVAQGTVSIERPDSKIAQSTTSDGTGPLKIMRYPAIVDPHASFEADTETLSAILNFIPLADQKIKALRDKAAGGATLTANEQAYLARLKQVPCVVKLTLVEPPAPAPAAMPKPIISTLALNPLPPPAPAATPSTEPTVPVQIALHPDGTVDLMGQTMDLTEFQTRLTAIAKANPAQTVTITGRDKVSHDQYLKVRAIYKALHLKAAKSLPAPPVATPAPVVETTPEALPTPTPAPTPVPAPVAETPVPAAPVATAPAETAPTATPPTNPPAPAKAKPLTARIRVDGKVNLQGATFGIIALRARLATLAKTMPDQEFVVRANKSVAEEDIEPVRAAFTDSGLQHVTYVLPPVPAGTLTPAPAESPAENLPTPGLLMHPSMEPRTSNPTPTDTNSTNTPSSIP